MAGLLIPPVLPGASPIQNPLHVLLSLWSHPPPKRNRTPLHRNRHSPKGSLYTILVAKPVGHGWYHITLYHQHRTATCSNTCGILLQEEERMANWSHQRKHCKFLCTPSPALNLHRAAIGAVADMRGPDARGGPGPIRVPSIRAKASFPRECTGSSSTGACKQNIKEYMLEHCTSKAGGRAGVRGMCYVSRKSIGQASAGTTPWPHCQDRASPRFSYLETPFVVSSFRVPSSTVPCAPSRVPPLRMAPFCRQIPPVPMVGWLVAEWSQQAASCRLHASRHAADIPTTGHRTRGGED